MKATLFAVGCMPLLGAALIFRPILLILLNFADRRKIGFHDVHDPIVIHKTAEAFKMAKELLLFLTLTRQLNVSNQE